MVDRLLTPGRREQSRPAQQQQQTLGPLARDQPTWLLFVLTATNVNI